MKYTATPGKLVKAGKLIAPLVPVSAMFVPNLSKFGPEGRI
jgi:hypothetical protein